MPLATYCPASLKTTSLAGKLPVFRRRNGHVNESVSLHVGFRVPPTGPSRGSNEREAAFTARASQAGRVAVWLPKNGSNGR